MNADTQNTDLPFSLPQMFLVVSYPCELLLYSTALVGRICWNAAVGASTVEPARYVPVLKISEACVECVLRS